MPGGDIYHTDHAVLVHHPHFRTDSVGLTLVDRNVIVGIADTVVHNRGNHKPETPERIERAERVLQQLLVQQLVLMPEVEHLLFESGGAALQIFVDRAKIDISRHAVGGVVHA